MIQDDLAEIRPGWFHVGSKHDVPKDACYVGRSGEQLADYLRFLAFSGAREKEALRVKWADVEFRTRAGNDRCRSMNQKLGKPHR